MGGAGYESTAAAGYEAQAPAELEMDPKIIKFRIRSQRGEVQEAGQGKIQMNL